MNFQEAIQKIEERGDFNRYAEVKAVFEEQLRKLKPRDHTERGLCYYYLLVSYLKAQLVHETEESIGFYKAMDEAFLKQEKEYKDHADKFLKSEIQDFFTLMERCYNALEFLYERHSFKVRRTEAYERKMYFRKNAYFRNKQFGKGLEYKFLELSCLYGTSLFRWALTTLGFIVLVSFAYMALDWYVEPAKQMIPENAHWIDYFYYSVIVMTTVGLGDIYPLTNIGKILTSAEAFFGFLMLGIFIGMLQKRIN